MADLIAFSAYRPSPEHVARVACPPYDVITTEEARALAAGNPDSFLHVTRPEIDLPEGTDEHGEPVYERGAVNLRALVERGLLVADTDRHLYVYEQRMGQHQQVGVVGCAAVRDYDEGRIKKHEKTRPDKEDDRTRHIDALGAHDEPVFLAYRAQPSIDRLVESIRQGAPTYDFASADGVAHRFWVVDAARTRELARAFEGDVASFYVADGHHRSAAASRVHARRKGDGGEHDVFLVVAFPHDQMNILAYNRVVRDPQGRSAAELHEALSRVVELTLAEQAAPTEPGVFGLYLGGRWYHARPRPDSRDEQGGDPVSRLDCSVCQDRILAPVFGVDDPRKDPNLGFVGGIHGAAELERRVDSGEASVAIYLFPTSMTDVMSVSDAGGVMPPKSTWFEPKLKSGLFVHTF